MKIKTNNRPRPLVFSDSGDPQFVQYKGEYFDITEFKTPNPQFSGGWDGMKKMGNALLLLKITDDDKVVMGEVEGGF